jgi:hypothetical protein
MRSVVKLLPHAVNRRDAPSEGLGQRLWKLPKQGKLPATFAKGRHEAVPHADDILGAAKRSSELGMYYELLIDRARNTGVPFPKTEPCGLGVATTLAEQFDSEVCAAPDLDSALRWVAANC